MEFDYSLLEGKITEKYKTRHAFAYAIQMSERSLSLKLNNKVWWKQPEIDKAINALGISEKNIPIYFFKKKVQNN